MAINELHPPNESVRAPDDGAVGVAATKLRPPGPPTRLVSRTRLEDVLDDSVARSVPLLLVSAPAGSGKSTLLAAWAETSDRQVAWLQIEEGDSDPASFWSSLVAAIGRCRPDIASTIGPLVAGSQGDDRVVVPALVNAIAATDELLIVVIDDYYLIDNAGVQRGTERLIDLCPMQLSIVISTRLDPPFRLGRMRVRSRVTEVRADRLRFDPAEAVALLGPSGGTLSAQRLNDLCAKTEGWAAGLVLAGFSLDNAADPDGFVDTFRGDDQLVVSYLSDELLDAMSAGDRQRLLETAVLEHLTGPLIDAVTGSSDGARWLADIANRNQLVVRLDNTGEWFRYHHLLRDLLLLEARRTIPTLLPELHRRAAEWFAAHGDRHQAVVHRYAAGDIPGAIELMYLVGPDLLGRGQIRKLRGYLEQAGDAAATDTACALGWGWCEYLSSNYESAKRWLDIALDVAPATFDPVNAAALRINLAVGSGDIATALASAQQATAAGSLSQRRAEVATAVGAAYTWAGKHDDAVEALTIAVARSKDEQRLTANVLALISAAINEVENGEPSAAHAAAVEAIVTAEAFGLATYHGVAPAFAVRGRTAADPDAARSDVLHAVEIARRATTDLGLAYVLTTCGDVLLEQGDDAGAALIVEARTRLDRCVDPGVAARYLARVESRHHITSSRTPTSGAARVELTDRELAVLRYLPTKLSQREIAAALYVSTNTVKTHASAIFRKLGVNDRKNAVQAARDSHLL